MVKKIKVNAVFNKANGQLTFSIPKKKISKKMFSDIKTNKKLKISLEGMK